MEIFQAGELEEEMRKRDYQANSISAIWNLFTSSYEEAITSLTCPARASYMIDELGSTHYALGEIDGELLPEHDDDAQPARERVVREDFQLTNVRGETLECSFWHKTPMPMNNGKAPPCIVYLHGMSSSRKECVYLRHKVLSAGFTLFAVDLSGSGLSEGEHVAYGHYEKEDLRAVLDCLFATGKASAVGIWGRCIGGATTLLHLRDALSYSYKTVTISKQEALQLRIDECRQTGELVCVRPSRVLPFRMTQVSASNGDFVILSIGNRPVKGMSIAECQDLIKQHPGDTIRIAGYEHRKGVSTGVTCKFVFALTLDSTFGDMEQVIGDMLMEVGKSAEKRNVSFPSTMMAAASKIISHSVRKRAGFQFKDIAVLDDVDQIQLPCLFVSASKVDFIRPEHLRSIYERYGGEKEWLPFQGVHDQNRPEIVVDAVCNHFVARWKGF